MRANNKCFQFKIEDFFFYLLKVELSAASTVDRGVSIVRIYSIGLSMNCVHTNEMHKVPPNLSIILRANAAYSLSLSLSHSLTIVRWPKIRTWHSPNTMDGRLSRTHTLRCTFVSVLFSIFVFLLFVCLFVRSARCCCRLPLPFAVVVTQSMVRSIISPVAHSSRCIFIRITFWWYLYHLWSCISGLVYRVSSLASRRQWRHQLQTHTHSTHNTHSTQLTHNAHSVPSLRSVWKKLYFISSLILKFPLSDTWFTMDDGRCVGWRRTTCSARTLCLCLRSV